MPGLVTQIKGIPTKKRYTCATVFVDLYSDFSFVHFQYMMNAQETLEAKIAFERYAKSHDVDVMLIMVNLQRTSGRQMLIKKNNSCPMQELMPISRTEGQRRR